jgi:type IX secretion system PorP/SprF family membrane protein
LIKHFYFLFLICFSALRAQEMNYSMPHLVPLVSNPAYTGNFNGTYRISAFARNQNININNTSMPGTYNSYGMIADAQILKEKTGDNTFGIGILFNNDHAGMGSLTTTDLKLSASYRLSLNRFQTSFLTAGIMGGLSSKRIFNKDLVFENQVDGFEFNPNIPNFEDFLDGATRTQFNYSIGVLYQQKTSDQFGFQFGVSIYNLAGPSDFFLQESKSFTYNRYSFMGGLEINSDESLYILPSFYYFQQGDARQLNLGINIRKMIQEDFGITGGIRYRLNDAIIPQVGMIYQNFQVYLSYDHTVSSLAQANLSNGAFELNFSYIFGNQEDFSYNGKQFCPTF